MDINKLKSAYAAAFERKQSKAEFIVLAHSAMPALLALFEAVDDAIAPDGDLKTMDLSRVVKALADLKGE